MLIWMKGILWNASDDDAGNDEDPEHSDGSDAEQQQFSQKVKPRSTTLGATIRVPLSAKGRNWKRRCHVPVTSNSKVDKKDDIGATGTEEDPIDVDLYYSPWEPVLLNDFVRNPFFV